MTTEKIHCNLSNDKISGEEWREIEERMNSKNFSTSGFLGSDEKLLDVIDKDEKYITSQGFTFEQIANFLETILNEYRQKYNDPDEQAIILWQGQEYKIQTITWMGAQQCPFQNHELDSQYHGYSYGSQDVNIHCIETDEKISFNTLLIHMIRQHHFFEGYKCSHRLDPEKLIKMFNLKPSKQYKSKYTIVGKWSFHGGCSHCKTDEDPFALDFLRKIAIAEINIGDDHIGLLFPTNELHITDRLSSLVFNYIEYMFKEEDIQSLGSNDMGAKIQKINPKRWFDFRWSIEYPFRKECNDSHKRQVEEDPDLPKKIGMLDYALTDEQLEQKFKNEIQKELDIMERFYTNTNDVSEMFLRVFYKKSYITNHLLQQANLMNNTTIKEQIMKKQKEKYEYFSKQKFNVMNAELQMIDPMSGCYQYSFRKMNKYIGYE